MFPIFARLGLIVLLVSKSTFAFALPFYECSVRVEENQTDGGTVLTASPARTFGPIPQATQVIQGEIHFKDFIGKIEIYAHRVAQLGRVYVFVTNASDLNASSSTSVSPFTKIVEGQLRPDPSGAATMACRLIDMD